MRLNCLSQYPALISAPLMPMKENLLCLAHESPRVLTAPVTMQLSHFLEPFDTQVSERTGVAAVAMPSHQPPPHPPLPGQLCFALRLKGSWTDYQSQSKCLGAGEGPVSTSAVHLGDALPLPQRPGSRAG